MKTDAKVSAVRIKFVRENKGEGVVGGQRVMLVQLAMHYSPALLQLLADNIEQPVSLSITAGQGEIPLPPVEEASEDPAGTRPRKSKAGARARAGAN